jgi:hypothetical protein
MIFGGVDSYNIWHTMVVVVCKFELICKISKMAQSRICLNVATLLDENLKLRKICRGGLDQSCSP